MDVGALPNGRASARKLTNAHLVSVLNLHLYSKGFVDGFR
ncbi:MAG: hypothetical protein QOG23_4677 [Blastocatellia bacterium]|jgi:hypothetical protein|nr:hypothetical protein [Blastocatellia bacterium]